MTTKEQAERMYLQMHISAFLNMPMLTKGPDYFKFGSSYTVNNQSVYFKHDLPILSPLEKCEVISKYFNQIEAKDGNNATYNCVEDNDVAWLRVSWKKN